VVLPSTYNEGIPRSLLEALACGKPVITTDWKGCRETVEHEKNGFLVKPDDTKSLLDAFESMARREANELLLMGQSSRELAERRFDERIVLDAYLGALGEG
jgi:glycosyltransferase involved in cell wall biosynthesis